MLDRGGDLPDDPVGPHGCRGRRQHLRRSQEERRPDFPYDFSDAEKFLNDPSVRAALGVGDRKWETCSGKVHEDMMADWMRNLEPTIPPMLEGGVRVMIYAGENDFHLQLAG